MRYSEILISVSKNILILLAVASFATIVFAEEPKEKRNMQQDKEYRADKVYAGEYLPMGLYYRHARSQPWMHASKSDTYLERVAGCADAKKKLSEEGKWVGNLNADGSCATAVEPAVYMLGNRLNYDEAMKNN